MSTSSRVCAAFVLLALAGCPSTRGILRPDAGAAADSGDSTPPPDVDAGSPTPPDVDAGDPRFDVPSTCTSGLFWPPFDIGTDIMRPGEACISCHTARGRGTIYTFAGTVYPTGHEPSECVGTGGASGSPVTVEVTDMTGRVVDVTANGSGTFDSTTPLTFPITAVVRYQGRENPMIGEIHDGDCNGCHTPTGAMDAPGRIITP